jgi:hypothetical protein
MPKALQSPCQFGQNNQPTDFVDNALELTFYFGRTLADYW